MSVEQIPIRVMTVDDNEIMRGGIKFVLMAFDDVVLVGEARRGEDAVQVCQETNPDVVLMDMKMSGMDGVQTTTAIKAACPSVQVLILTSFHDQDLVRRSMNAGAIGYVLKDASKEELATSIRSAKAGQTTFCREATEDLLAEPIGESDLTDREIEVLTLLVKGFSNKEIGKKLHRSHHTVRNHVSHIMQKLHAANRAELAAIATERGLTR